MSPITRWRSCRGTECCRFWGVALFHQIKIVIGFLIGSHRMVPKDAEKRREKRGAALVSHHVAHDCVYFCIPPTASTLYASRVDLFPNLLAYAGLAATFTVDVGVGGNNFSPRNITIQPGDTVTWQWHGAYHTVQGAPSGDFPEQCLSDPTPPDFHQAQMTGTFSYTFTTAGTYNYFCNPHCYDDMTGVVQVGDVTFNGTQPPTTAPLVTTAPPASTNAPAPSTAAPATTTPPTPSPTPDRTSTVTLTTTSAATTATIMTTSATSVATTAATTIFDSGSPTCGPLVVVVILLIALVYAVHL